MLGTAAIFLDRTLFSFINIKCVNFKKSNIFTVFFTYQHTFINRSFFAIFIISFVRSQQYFEFFRSLHLLVFFCLCRPLFCTFILVYSFILIDTF